MSTFTWAVTVLVICLLAAFVVNLVSLRRLHLQIRRPPVRYARLGQVQQNGDEEPPEPRGFAQKTCAR